MRTCQVGDTSVTPGQMRQDMAPGRIGQGGEGAIQCSRRILNHLVNYLARPFSCANTFFPSLLQSLTDRAGRSNNGPRAKRQQRPEHQRFNRKVHVILAREKISGELENRSSSSRSPLF